MLVVRYGNQNTEELRKGEKGKKCVEGKARNREIKKRG
jgi:hypothetical protein